MNPKFEVGEVVILQSVTHPHYNGEYTVRFVFNTEEIYQRTNQKLSQYSFGYELVGVRGVIWAGGNLRKKHQPGELSFTNLMAQLNQPVEV